MDRPLFVRYPQLRKVLPCEALAQLPTPVHALSGLPNGWIKRDEQTDPVFGGNKLRKLEFVLAEMRAQGARRAYTFGATGTNAGVAAALACQRAGIALTIYTFDQPNSLIVEANQARMRAAGARLVRKGTLAAAVRAFYVNPARLQPDAYFLFAGCSNPCGVFGYVNAALELAEQVAQGALPLPQAIVVPVGSNGTLAGLAVGLAAAGLSPQLVGVRVAPSHLGPFATCTTAEVQRMANGAVNTLRRHVPELADLRVTVPLLDGRYFGAGYGVPSVAAEQAMQRFAEQWNVTLEGTYSGKAAAAFLDLVATADGPILFWQTFAGLAGQPATGVSG